LSGRRRGSTIASTGIFSAVDVQQTMAERNAGVPEDRRITYRMGINIGDIIVEGDDIYGKRVNVAARLEGLSRRRSGTLSHRR
jgi:adenylate cyclase